MCSFFLRTSSARTASAHYSHLGLRASLQHPQTAASIGFALKPLPIRSFSFLQRRHQPRGTFTVTQYDTVFRRRRARATSAAIAHQR